MTIQINSSIFYCLMIFAVDGFQNFLIYPKPTLEQLIFTVSCPVQLKNRPIVVSAGYQMNFEEPTNETQLKFEDFVSDVRSASSLHASDIFDRYDIYKYFEKTLHGFNVDGHVCLLRLICELAKHPIENRSSYLIEDLIHYLFTPSEDKNHSANYYLEAEQLGKSDSNCHQEFIACDYSILDWFTQLI